MKNGKVVRDVPGAPGRVRGGSNRSAAQVAHRQRPVLPEKREPRNPSD